MAEIAQLKTLLKHADALQDLIFDHNELERKRKLAIETDFSVKKSIAEYKYFKGLEAKSFVVFQVLIALLSTILFVSFYSFFDQQIFALITSLILITGVNIGFVLIYKPYKVEEWYMAGMIFYGLMLAGFGMFLFAYLSIVFFLETGTFFLILLTLFNINLILSLLFGAVFPITFRILDDRAIKNPLLTLSIEELEKAKQEDIKLMSQELESIEVKINKVEKELDAITLIPKAYKGTKTIKILIHYFEEKRVNNIEEALKLYDLEEQDALRRMRMINLK